MINTFVLPFIKFYRWIRFRHGHGVHSPFAFSFINDVIEEKNGYYAYLRILKYIASVQLYSKLTLRELKYVQLLYRISNFFREKEIVQFGCINGESMLYLQDPSPDIKCTLVEADNKKIESALRLAGDNPNLQIVDASNSDFLLVVEKLLISDKSFGVFVFNSTLSDVVKQKSLEMCLNIQKERVVLIIEGIRNSRQNKLYWRTIINDDRISVSFDLIEFGVLIVDPQLKKRNYRLYF